MRALKAANALLWVANVAIGGAIVIFAFQYLIFPENVNPIEDVEADDGGPKTAGASTRKTDYTPLINFYNPVEPRTGPVTQAGPSSLKGELLGTVPNPGNPQDIIAYLLVGQKYVNAYFMEDVFSEGAPLAEFAGWKLSRVTRETATFVNAAGKEETLAMKTTPGALGSVSPDGGIHGGPAAKGKINVTKLQAGNNREVYGIDKAGIEFAMANQEELLKEVGLSDYASGGIQISSLNSGSLGEQVGLQVYDVIKTVNGLDVKNSLSIAELRNNEQLRRANQMILQVERAGQTRTIIIQPMNR